MQKYSLFLLSCLVLVFSGNALAGDPYDSFCDTLTLESIPVGDFHNPLALPMRQMRFTQKYNTSWAEGFCTTGGLQFDSSDPECTGMMINYTHDGVDLNPEEAAPGQYHVYSVQNSQVIASHKEGSFGRWGESVILATRLNEYSEELITSHYHHLHREINPYVTSRLFGACDLVTAGAPIALEGNTGGWPTHLHFSVKRWKNLAELMNAINYNQGAVYGAGYYYGNTSVLANRYLDPESYLYDYFTEFQAGQDDFPTWQWSLPYAMEMRYQGWFMGDYDGSFGVEKKVTRREAARWLKQALDLPTTTICSPNQFYDVPSTDRDFPYINTLARQVTVIPVVNPNGGCTASGHYFCPDQNLTRAQAIKMIVAGFFQMEFLDTYDNWVWKVAAPFANNILSAFQDVSAYAWFAPYVYFAWQKGLVGEGSFFYPDEPVRRAELAKWLVLAWQSKHGENITFCQSVSCDGGYFCEESTDSCQPLPECIPAEYSPCPLGGGYQIPGSEEDGTGGSGNSGSGGTVSSECTPGQEQLSLCPEANGATYRVCFENGQWSDWSPNCFTETGNTGNSGAGGTENTAGNGEGGNPGGSYSCTADPQYTNSCAMGVGICMRTGILLCNEQGDGLECSVYSATPHPLGEICDNELDDNCNGATDELPCHTEEAETDGGGGTGGAPQCTVQYNLSPSSASCFNNPSASGSPTLCLETKLYSDTQTSWRLCKQSGIFQSNFTYELLDQNHLYQNLDGVQSGNSGISCTAWELIDFSYLTQNGPANGAGLIVEVHSPSGCTSQACTYYTGITTLYRDCQ